MFSVFLSNQLEALYELLKKELYRVEQSPFSKRIVVVYGPAMKAYLMQKMAQDPDLSISIGIEWTYFNAFFEKIFKQANNSLHFPSSLELSLAIEQEIKSIILNPSALTNDERIVWEPVLNYFKFQQCSHRFSKKREKRLTELSIHLAKLFLDYGRFAPKMISDWENKISADWQQSLWQKIFFQNRHWSSPVKELYAQSIHPNILSSETSIHLFSISFLTTSEFTFLENLSQFTPINYYLISPCAVFWSDIKSDKEASRWHIRNKGKWKDYDETLELEELLRDRNPLLANFGRMGREMACHIEDSHACVHSSYSLPESALQIIEEDALLDDVCITKSAKPVSILQSLQADLLLMRNDDTTPYLSFEKDDSITLHIAPNMRREIEILVQNLIKAMQEDHKILPSDIIVMAPQITSYLPYIKSVFDAYDCPFCYRVLDVSMQMESEIVRSFLLLLDLCDNKWDAPSLLQLFSSPSFQRKHQISSSDRDTIHRWIEKAKIKWGYDWLHRRMHLNKRHCEEESNEDHDIGTWDFGFSRLMMGLTMTETFSDISSMSTPPCPSIDFSEGELFGKWIQLIRSLKDSLKPLEENTHLSLTEWSHVLTSLLEDYFECDINNALESENKVILKQKIQCIKAASQSIFPFSTVKTHLLILLKQRENIHAEEQRTAICFCSLVPMRTLPAKIIAIIGLQEENFPRQEHHTSLNRLINSRQACSYFPSVVDYDRTLFLEAIHSAREKLVLSYSSFNSKENKECLPSLVVQELFSYLDRHIKINGECFSAKSTFKHPLVSFDPLHFLKERRFSNFSNQDYCLAQCVIRPDKIKPHQFIKNFPYEKGNCEVSHLIELKNLNAIMRNPIKFYFKQKLRMTFQNELEKDSKNDDEISLSAYEKYQLKNLCLKNSLKTVFYRAEREGKLPQGLFKHVALSLLEEEMDEIFATLEQHQMVPESLFQIEFSLACTEIEQLQSNMWVFPPIILSNNEEENYTIIGKIAHASTQGLFSMSKGSFKDIWKHWPQFLLFCYASRSAKLDWQEQIIFAHSTKPKRPVINEIHSHLLRLCQYYCSCLKTPSPLLPELLQPILSGDIEQLKKEMKILFQTPFAGSEHVNMKRFFYKVLPDAHEIICNWQPILKGLLE